MEKFFNKGGEACAVVMIGMLYFIVATPFVLLGWCFILIGRLLMKKDEDEEWKQLLEDNVYIKE